MKAITYARWSSLEQKRGTSPARQHEITRDYATRMGWEIIEELTDSGMSAWTGENIRTGELGRLIERVERAPADHLVLVVEKLDRLSRQPPLVMTNWLQRATATGLTIATADGRHTITLTALMKKPLELMGVIFEAFRGYEEIETKSDRVTEAWVQKRKRGRPMTKHCPAWLRIEDKATSYRNPANLTARYEPIHERVTVVQRIFAQTIAGVGKATIAANLNREGVPVFGSGQGWHASYVQKILRNEAVIGRYQPHTKPKGGKRLPVGEPIDDYFHPVIDVATFDQANDKRASRVLAQQGAGQRLVNLFTGLAKCDVCGASMTLRNKGAETLADGRVVQRRYLQCSNSVRSANGCVNTAKIAYQRIETGVLEHLLDLAMDDQHFAQKTDVSAVENDIAAMRRALADADRRKKKAWQHVMEDDDDADASAAYRTEKDAVKALTAKLAALEETLVLARGKVSPGEHIARVNEVRQMMDREDDAIRYPARVRAKLALNDLIEAMTCAAGGHVNVTVREGLRSITIHADGYVRNYDLLHPRQTTSADPIVRDYIRRIRDPA